MRAELTAIAKSPAIRGVITRARRRGLSLDSFERKIPGIVAAVDAMHAEALAKVPSAEARERIRVHLGLPVARDVGQPVQTPTVTPPDEVASPVVPEAAASAPVSVERTPEQWRVIVEAAPEANVIAWLAERGIPRIDFYRARKALRG